MFDRSVKFSFVIRFGLESCTDHVEKATFVTSGSLFSENFRMMKLQLATGTKKYLINRILVFSR